MSLYMIQLGVRQRHLHQWAHDAGLNARDAGYLMHAAMRAAFGAAAPQPFTLLPQKARGELMVLGYSGLPLEHLLEQRQAVATPLLEAAFPHGGMLGKEMPQAWRAGRSYGFEVRFCPVARLTVLKDGKRKALERDAYLAACDQRGPDEHPLNREDVYLEWLERQIAREGAASMLEAGMAGFHLVKPVRRRQRPGKATSLGVKALRPDVLVRGRLKVEASQGFAGLLARGVGRHRAFGYGMLLIRPDPKEAPC